jgi:hypothetical protein
MSSKLVVNQVNNSWEVKCQDLIPLANEAKFLCKVKQGINLEYVNGNKMKKMLKNKR